MSPKTKQTKQPKQPKQPKPASKPPKSKNVSYGEKSGKGSAAKKIFILIAVIVLLAAAVILFNKLGGCSLIDNMKNYKDAYDGISGSDTQDISQDDGASYDAGKQEEPQVDNSSDASILDMFTSCGGKDGSDPADDIDYDRFSAVTGSDAYETVNWEQPENDAAYNSMMKEKSAEFITLFTQLEDLRSEFADSKSTAQVEKNERYIALRSKLLGWCSGAQTFSSASLGESSREASALASQIAADTRRYLALYPTYAVKPDSVKAEAEELQSSIIDNMLQLDDIVSAK